MLEWPAIFANQTSYDYEFEGWEPIDGQECARIRISNPGPAAQQERFWRRYGVDLGRGGHVLRYEMHRGEELWLRVHQVRLASIPDTKGKPVWLPIAAEVNSFINGSKARPDPVIVETDRVVTSSIAINHGLPDERFRVEWAGRTSTSPAYEKEKSFFAQQKGPPRPPRKRLTVSDIDKDLQEKLQQADTQTRALDASQPADSSVMPVIQTFLILGGVVILGVAWKMSRRV
jgi:hypothetical protein